MLYPLFLNIEYKPCVVVGGGSVAERRVKSLVRHGAALTVVAPEITPYLASLAAEGAISWVRKLYHPEHLNGAFLVVAATDSREVNKSIAKHANDTNQIVCCVDDPDAGNYLTAASVERGDFLLAVTTGGASPTLTAVIKSRLESQFGDEWGSWTKLFNSIRPDIQQLKTESDRKTLVEQILDNEDISRLILGGNFDMAEEAAKKCILSLSA